MHERCTLVYARPRRAIQALAVGTVPEHGTPSRCLPEAQEDFMKLALDDDVHVRNCPTP